MASVARKMPRQLVVAGRARPCIVLALPNSSSSTSTTPAQQRGLTTSRRLYGYRKSTTGLINIMEDRAGAMDRRVGRMLADEPPQRSAKTILRDLGMAGRVPTDLGLLPGTLVMPPWSQRPSLLMEPVAHVRTQATQLFKRFKDVMSMLIFKFYNGRPFLKLQNRKLPGIAKDLHHQMYSAFASGDVPELRDSLCRGLYNHYSSRIVARPPNVRYVWTLDRYLGRPRVVSQRATFLPLPPSKGRTPALRQAVVRIRSVQSLRAVRQTGTGDWVDVDSDKHSLADGAARAYDEYLVLQQRVFKGEPDEWRVWGTVTPTAWGEVRRVAAQSKPEGYGDEAAGDVQRAAAA